jgi:hypothetical protein
MLAEDSLVAAAANDEGGTMETAVTEASIPVTTMPATVHAMSTTMPTHAMSRSGGGSNGSD